MPFDEEYVKVLNDCIQMLKDQNAYLKRRIEQLTLELEESKGVKHDTN